MKRSWFAVLLASLVGAANAMAIRVGDPAPSFSGTATGGKTLSLSDLRGQWVVLYFYPKADTPGCTKESCALRDGYSDIQAKGAAVIGVSLDTLEKQEAFKTKYELPFPLIADTDKKIAEAYDVVAVGGLFAKRKTFIIDPEGKLAHVFEDVDVSRHQEEVLAELTRLQAAKTATP